MNNMWEERKRGWHPRGWQAFGFDSFSRGLLLRLARSHRSVLPTPGCRPEVRSSQTRPDLQCRQSPRGQPERGEGGFTPLWPRQRENAPAKNQATFSTKNRARQKKRKIRNVRIFRKMKCGRPNARQLQTCFPQKLKRTKTENTERPHFPNFQKRLRFRFLAGRKRKRPHPAPRGAGRETQRRLRKCKLEEGWTGEGRWAHAKRKQQKREISKH